jgi:hypothetical protein
MTPAKRAKAALDGIDVSHEPTTSLTGQAYRDLRDDLLLDWIERNHELVREALEQMADSQEYEKRVKEARQFAFRYGCIDGAHHKMWTIDQIVRILSGSEYEELVLENCAGADGPNTYSWDEGIAP